MSSLLHFACGCWMVVSDTRDRSDQARLFDPGQCVSEQFVHCLWALKALVIIVFLGH